MNYYDEIKTELKTRTYREIWTHMNYVDKNIKTIDEDKIIGIVICKKNNKLIPKRYNTRFHNF